MNRRDFLQFLGASGVISTLPGCTHIQTSHSFIGLPPSLEDDLITIDGITAKLFIKWGDPINPTQKFGFNNDFIAFHPLSESSAILWVNHEYVSPTFIQGQTRSKQNIDKERLEVGGSLLEISKINNEWKFVIDSKYNRRLDALTEIPFSWDQKIFGTSFGIGTLGNCAGGKTPWGTILTCEENYDLFYGDRDRNGNKTKDSWLKWDSYYPLPPEHYGWVVEIKPETGEAKKLISLGRFAHECATVTVAKSGKVVAYSGDDANDEHFYKFISDSETSLEKGKLYVANFSTGSWVSLDINDQPILSTKFKNQTEIQIFARQAAKLVGATPLDRPEDIEIDPLTGNILVTLTNNKPKKNYHGSIMQIIENDNDPGSMSFTHKVFLTGGHDNGFACPDNIIFDPKGNLWFTTDVTGEDIDKAPYTGFGNNGLFVFIRSGKYKGQVFRLASAPVDAELTGPCFSPDFKTLFLSVQHPGEVSTSLEKLTSTWPDRTGPKPAVVTLTGPLLDRIIEGRL